MNYAERDSTEAKALGISVTELKTRRTDSQDIKEAKMRGTEVWELRMRRAGRSKREIEHERARMMSKSGGNSDG